MNLNLANTCSTHAGITHDIIDYKKSVRYSERVSQGVNKSKLDSTTSTIEMFQIESCVRGHHINKDIWNPSTGKPRKRM